MPLLDLDGVSNQAQRRSKKVTRKDLGGFYVRPNLTAYERIYAKVSW